MRLLGSREAVDECSEVVQRTVSCAHAVFVGVRMLAAAYVVEERAATRCEAHTFKLALRMDAKDPARRKGRERSPVAFCRSEQTSNQGSDTHM